MVRLFGICSQQNITAPKHGTFRLQICHIYFKANIDKGCVNFMQFIAYNFYQYSISTIYYSTHMLYA